MLLYNERDFMGGHSILEDSATGASLPPGVLMRVKYDTAQAADKKNRNNRVYTEKLWKRLSEDAALKERTRARAMFG